MKTLKILLIVFTLFLVTCKKDNNTGINLTGEWTTHLTSPSGDTVSSIIIYIIQTDNNINFYQDEEIISTGKITDDILIKCDDMFGLGISKIYIDNSVHMYSELPLCESCGTAFFEK